MPVAPPPGPTGPARSRVTVGRFTFEVGAPAGTLIAVTREQADSRGLAKAIAEGEKEDARFVAGHRGGATAERKHDALTTATEDATVVTSKIERAVNLFTELAEGRVDPRALSDEIDALLGVLGRLDRDGRNEEALRLARALAGVLALVGRWIELARSLHTALRAAEELGDSKAAAWAMHELGTLHLGAENARVADRRLSQAQEIRQRISDDAGLAATNHNLQVLCRVARELLQRKEGRLEKLGKKPALAAAAAAILVAGGGVAGAMVNGSSSNQPSNSSSNQPSSQPPNQTGSGSNPNNPSRPTPAEITPDSVDFGPVEFGGSTSQTVTAKNLGALPITLGSVEISDNTRDFRPQANRCADARLEPGGTCAVSVAFQPQAVPTSETPNATTATTAPAPAEQTRTGTLTFSDTGTGRSRSITLTGVATRPSPG